MNKTNKREHQLARNGGEKIIQKNFKRYNSIGKEEMNAAMRVLESGCLSKYIGSKGEDFMGGVEVNKFENAAAKLFNVKYAIAVNSWTSGLITSIGAIGIEPGDEVIVTTWTMTATATAILHWNAIPVFADIDPETFNIDPKDVEKKINEKTKAVIAVDIFGQSCNLNALKEITKKYNLKLITDSAQAPGSFYNSKLTGTEADIGGFSLNYHKHIHCGEGGLIVTNDEDLARRSQLIRNHGEAVISAENNEDLKNIIGYNFRMGEIEAAIATEQLKKLTNIVKNRQEIAAQLDKGLGTLKGLKIPIIDNSSTHVYYVYGMLIDEVVTGKTRDWIHEALTHEGVPALMKGYANIHLLPIFQKKIAYGKDGFPWKGLGSINNQTSYEKGICPIAEDYHDNKFIGIQICMFEFSQEEIDDTIRAFKKVWRSLK